GEQAYVIDAVQQLIAEQRDQGAAHHWADDSSDGHHRHIQRARRRQQFEGDDRRQKGSSCRLVESEAGLLHREHGQQQPDVVDAQHCDAGEYGAGDGEPDGGGDEQLASVDDIGQRAAPEGEDHERNETEGSGESDVSRGPGDVEDLGRDRNDCHLGTDDGDDVGQPEAPEGSVLQRANISEEPHRSQTQADFLFVLFRDLGTSVGATLESTTSLVTTTSAMSSREGTSNMTGWRTSSMIDRSPRAPVPRSSARSAIASR